MPRPIHKKQQDIDAPKRIPQRVKLSDESASPGIALMERIAHSRRPSKEDLAILDAWAFRFPVTYL